MRIINYLISTFFGSGFAPFAPGTAGSMLAAVLFFILPISDPVWIGIIVIIFFIGVYSSTIIERERGEDPGIVVIDEAVGQWISFLFLPHTIWIFILGFGLFRAFDIWKPFPIDRSQKLKAGWGIMIDDVLAGIYANIILQIIIYGGLL